MDENAWISLTISFKYVRKVRINNIPSLVQIMALRRPGDKPFSEPMMVSLLTNICVTRPQWDNNCLASIWISIAKIRRSHDRLIFIATIPMLSKERNPVVYFEEVTYLVNFRNKIGHLGGDKSSLYFNRVHILQWLLTGGSTADRQRMVTYVTTVKLAPDSQPHIREYEAANLVPTSRQY